jgi:hypothetical protein
MQSYYVYLKLGIRNIVGVVSVISIVRGGAENHIGLGPDSTGNWQ